MRCTHTHNVHVYMNNVLDHDPYIVASTLKPFISRTLYKNIHGFDVDATIYNYVALLV